MTSGTAGNGFGSRESLPPPPHVPPAAPPNGNGPLRRTVRVVNPLGLHHRVADLFSNRAKQFACAVTVWNESTRANGKSLWDLIMLVAMPDTELILEVDGADAADAIGPLGDILAAPSSEDYTI